MTVDINYELLPLLPRCCTAIWFLELSLNVCYLSCDYQKPFGLFMRTYCQNLLHKLVSEVIFTTNQKLLKINSQYPSYKSLLLKTRSWILIYQFEKMVTGATSVLVDWAKLWICALGPANWSQRCITESVSLVPRWTSHQRKPSSTPKDMYDSKATLNVFETIFYFTM